MENLDRYVGAYEDTFPYMDDNIGVLRAYAKQFVDACAGRPDLSICSLGIGYEIVSKTIASQLADRMDRYVIVEGSPAIIEKYRQTMDFPFRVDLVESYFETYSPDEGFDVVEMGFVLEHVDDPALIVRRFTQFLKPGGIIVAAVPNARSLHRVLGQRAGLLEDMYALSQWDHELGHKRYFDSDTFRALFEGEGLAIGRETGLMLKPFSTAQLKQLALPEQVWETLCFSGDLSPRYAYSLYLEASA